MFDEERHSLSLDSVTRTSGLDLVGHNSPIIPFNEETQALINAALHKPASKKSTPRKKESKPIKPDVPQRLSVPNTASEFSDFDEGDDAFPDGELDDFCDEYGDVDFQSIGIDPGEPTKAQPGSEEKVLMLAARYAAGMPLWHSDDVTDYEPSSKGQELRKIAEANFDVTNAKKKSSRDE